MMFTRPRPLKHRLGFTLVETLIALAVATLIVLILARVVGATRAVHDLVDRRATATVRATAVPRLLADAIGRAGRGLDACALLLGEPGRWAGVAVDPGEALAATIEVFADRDSGGRPALYHRTLPWARQPWLEDVVGFAILEARDAGGTWRLLAGDGATRWTAVRVAVTWSDGDARTYDVRLPHAPCAVAS